MSFGAQQSEGLTRGVSLKLRNLGLAGVIRSEERFRSSCLAIEVAKGGPNFLPRVPGQP